MDTLDQDLIRAANRGDAQAMEALYERYKGWVTGFALRLCGDEHDALDVMQETFAYLFGKFPGFTLRCQMKTFLYPVVRNLSLNLMRKRRTVAMTAEANGVAADTTADALSFAEIVSTLSPAERDVVVLRFDEGHELARIAEILGVPLGTVKSRLHRALERLRAHLSGA